jgi:acyl-CoA thioester hydrolase
MSITNGTHHHPIRIYYEDTDAGGIVYHASYLRFAERARTEMLREIGFAHQRLVDEHSLAMVVRHLEIGYVKPARLDDLVTVRTNVVALGRASLKIAQIVVASDGAVLAEMKVRLACIDLQGRPAALPEPLLDAAASLLDVKE